MIAALPGDERGLDHARRIQRGHRRIHLEHTLLAVALVAAEQLVTPVARKQVRNAVLERPDARSSRSGSRTNCRRARRMRRDSRKHIDDVFGRHLIFVRLGAEAAIGDVRVFELVELVQLESPSRRSAADAWTRGPAFRQRSSYPARRSGMRRCAHPGGSRDCVTQLSCSSRVSDSNFAPVLPAKSGCQYGSVCKVSAPSVRTCQA